MISVSILEDIDVIQSTDYVRQLSLTFEGQSDYLATTATYGGGAINRLGWIPAKYFCPFWVGKTVKEFRSRMEATGRHSSEVCDYEFIRGDIPKSHLEKLTKKQIEIAEMILSRYGDE